MAEKNNKIKVTIYGYDVMAIEEATKLTIEALSQLKLTFGNFIKLKTKIKSATTLISPHKHKKLQEKFEQRTHKRVIYIDGTCPLDLKTLEEKLKIPRTAHLEIEYVD